MLLDHAQCPVDQQRVCKWAGCSMPIIPGLFSEPLHYYHRIVGSDESKVRCDWWPCGVEMNMESSHVAEVHRGIKFKVSLFSWMLSSADPHEGLHAP